MQTDLHSRNYPEKLVADAIRKAYENRRALGKKIVIRNKDGQSSKAYFVSIYHPDKSKIQNDYIQRFKNIFHDHRQNIQVVKAHQQQPNIIRSLSMQTRRVRKCGSLDVAVATC